MVEDLFTIFPPYGLIIIGILLQTIFGLIKSPRLVFKYKNVNIITSNIISILSVIGAAIGISLIPDFYLGFENSIKIQPFSKYLSYLVLFSGLTTILLNGYLLKENRQSCYKYHILLLTAILGGLLTLVANDFITLFVSLETLSFAIYFLIAFSRGYSSKEASFKYLITNSVSIAFLLFGVSYLLGITSSVNFDEITQILQTPSNTIIYTVSCLMIFAGLVMKLAIFPFANWIIDVYTGTDTSTLNLLSTIPKISIIGVLIHLLSSVMSFSFELTITILLLSILTAFWANIYAIKENNIKRILACSSSANACYLLIALPILTPINNAAIIFYLLCYILINSGIFSYLNLYEPEIKDFELSKIPKPKNYILTIAFAISVIGLAGLPISSGFVAKIYLLYAIISSGIMFLPILIVLLILFAIALYYYIKILKIILNPEIGQKPSKGASTVLASLGIITLILGVVPFYLITYCIKLFS